jgi:hypothetical protein
MREREREGGRGGERERRHAIIPIIPPQFLPYFFFYMPP